MRESTAQWSDESNCQHYH